nr:hypothetical protein [Tanacetum cinerariifolium]
MEVIEKRFGGNTETKKVQKTLLKQQYENFIGSSSESLDQIRDRLLKLISQLEIIGVSLSEEDINLKFFRSLPSDWRTHTLIWRNKTDLEEQSLDDLFNSLKIWEAEVKSSSSASTTTQNIAFVSSSNIDSNNEPVSAAASVFAVSAKIHVSPLLNVDSLMRARRFLQRTGRNLGANGPTSMGFDMSKVECYNCHRKRHFARECRSPKDTRRNNAAEPQRRNVPVETSTSNTLVSQCDGMGSYDYSFQAEEEPTNYALMTFSSSSSSSDNKAVSCSKACIKAYATLQSHYDKLTEDYRKSQFDVISYQTGLESVEAGLLIYQQNKSVFVEDRTFMPPKPDLVFNNAPNDVKTDHPAFNVKLSPTKTYHDLSHTNRPSAPIIEDWVSDSEDESETKTPQNVPSFVQPTEQVKSPRTFIQHVETSILTSTLKTTIPKPTSNGKRMNRKACFMCKSLDHLIKYCDYRDQKMAQTSSRNHAQRGNHKQYARMPLFYPQRHVIPTTVVPKSQLVPINTARPITADVPKIKVTRPRHDTLIVTKPNSPIRRHINCSPSPKASNFPPKVTAV